MQEGPAIKSHLIGVLLAFVLSLGEALVLESLSRAFDPLDWHIGTDPFRSDLCEHIQHLDHRLSDTQHSVERTDLGQHMGRVSALPPPSFEPTPFLAPLQEEI